MGQPAALLLGVVLVISAASTMDSTFSSTAKLAVVDMGIGRGSPAHGRIEMAVFALLGLVMVFFGAHIASLGNVEAQLVDPQPGAGCGCAYPASTPEQTVAWSNAIIARLQETAALPVVW